LFFLFLGHYTTWLLPSAFVGVFFWSFVASAGNDPNVPEITFFSVYVSIWGTLFLEYWKRKEKLHAMKWGMVGFEDGSQPDRWAMMIINITSSTIIIILVRHH